MTTLETKLNYLYSIKRAIAGAIVEKGVSVSDTDTFLSYAGKIRAIEGGQPGGGGPEIEINDLVDILYPAPYTISVLEDIDRSTSVITNVGDWMAINGESPESEPLSQFNVIDGVLSNIAIFGTITPNENAITLAFYSDFASVSGETLDLG